MMKTIVCNETSDAEVQLAAEVLKAGGLVIFPTETVYGLGALISRPDALKKIYAIKGRQEKKPLSILLADASWLDQVAELSQEDRSSQVKRQTKAKPLSKSAVAGVRKLAETFWPGPLTLVLPKKERVPDEVTSGLPTIGIRIPDHAFALQLLEAVGEPVATTSANLSGADAATNAASAVKVFDGKVDLIIDGGECAVKVASTVAAIETEGNVKILRQGILTGPELARCAGFAL